VVTSFLGKSPHQVDAPRATHGQRRRGRTMSSICSSGQGVGLFDLRHDALRVHAGMSPRSRINISGFWIKRMADPLDPQFHSNFEISPDRFAVTGANSLESCSWVDIHALAVRDDATSGFDFRINGFGGRIFPPRPVTLTGAPSIVDRRSSPMLTASKSQDDAAGVRSFCLRRKVPYTTNAHASSRQQSFVLMWGSAGEVFGPCNLVKMRGDRRLTFCSTVAQCRFRPWLIPYVCHD